MKKAYLSMGSNLGDRIDYLNKALSQLVEPGTIEISKVSSFYETDPVGYEDQSKFFNIVVEIQTKLSPHDLLDLCLSVELALGRKRLFKNGPRTIDIDILLYEGVTLDESSLTIPHPRMLEREFVMEPLKEINPDLDLVP